MRYLTTTKNLFNYKTPEYVNATLIQSLPNGTILKGKASSSPGSGLYINGWFRPGYANNANKVINLKAGDVVTISADYTLIEQYSLTSNTCNINLYCTVDKFNLSTQSYTKLPLGQTVRISKTYTVEGDGGYYPVFTINSNTVMITNIQIEKSSTATPYVPYGYLPMYKGRYKVSDVCQLLDKSEYLRAITKAGITTISNRDGSITINGTATASSYINCTPPYPRRNNGHVFYVCANNTTMSSSTWYYGLLNQNGYDYGGGVIRKTNASKETSTGIAFVKDVVFNNVIIKPQIIDLTEMYGAGNEPTTVAEFREKFPDELYPYSPYCWAKLKSLIYKDDIEYIKMK